VASISEKTEKNKFTSKADEQSEGIGVEARKVLQGGGWEARLQKAIWIFIGGAGLAFGWVGFVAGFKFRD
jgi:hypothetical protein